MSRTFFGVLKNLEKSSADGVLPNEADSLLRRLIRFVEGGSFTKSETEKFILENFRLSSAELTRKWNDLQFGRKKEDSTFRGQMSVLSHYLCSLFSIASDELNDAFYNQEVGVLKRIAGLLDAFELGDLNIAERFSVIVQGGFLPAYTTDSVYDMKDCLREIPYNLEFSRTLSDILTKRSKERMTSEEAVRWSGMTEAQKDEEKKRLVRFLLAFTEGGFRKLLSRYNPLAVQEVLDENYSVEEGKSAYPFRK